MEQLTNIYKEFYGEIIAGSDKLSDYLDSIIVWVITLSTGSIALIFASTGKTEFITKESMNSTLIFLLLTIFLGVWGRGLSAVASYFNYHLVSSFTFGLKLLDILPKERQIEGNESCNEVFEYLKIDYPTHYESIIEVKNLILGSDPEKYDLLAQEFYNSFIQAKKDEYKNAMQHINKLMIDSLGLKENYFENRKSEKNRLKSCIATTCNNVSLLMYIVSLCCYILAIVDITCKYLN